MEKNKMKNNFIWNLIGSTLNSFTSFFFLIIVTRINGLNDAGVFTFAFSTACILFIFGTYAGRIFQVTDTTEINDKEFVTSRIITCSLSIIICLLFVLINKYNVSKSLIIILLCIFKMIESFSDVLYGILQKNERLDIVGKSYSIKSVLSVASFLILDLLTKDVLLSIISMIIISTIVSIVLDFRLSIKLIDKKSKINKKDVMKIFSKGFAVFIISFMPIAVVNVPKYIIDYYLNDELQAIFGIIIMPATVLTLFSQFIIHPALNNVTNLNKNKDYASLKKMILKMILLVIGFGILCILAAYLLGIPVLEIIYGVNLKTYRIDLAIVLLAGTICTMAGIISPFLIAMRYNVSQVIMGFITIIFEVLLSIIMVKKYLIDGVIYAYLISMIVYFVLYFTFIYILLNKKIKGAKK